jgi:hypothetical protein
MPRWVRQLWKILTEYSGHQDVYRVCWPGTEKASTRVTTNRKALPKFFVRSVIRDRFVVIVKWHNGPEEELPGQFKTFDLARHWVSRRAYDWLDARGRRRKPK